MARKLPVRILNPAPDGSSFATYKRALLFVRSGFASWDISGVSIRLHHHVAQAAVRRYDATRRGYDDVRRVMSLDEIAGLPCCRPEMALWGRDQRAT